MRPILVVILDPLLGNLSGLVKVREEVFVKDFVSASSIEALDKCVLAGLAWLDISKLNTPVFSPLG